MLDGYTTTLPENSRPGVPSSTRSLDDVPAGRVAWVGERRRAEPVSSPRHRQSVPATEDGSPPMWSAIGMNPVLQSEARACTAPDRLLWVAEFLDLADKPISVIACVQGLDYPRQVHGAAQRDLRAW